MNYSKQRKVILEVVKNRHDHPTAEMIYNEAKKNLDTIGIATVYRNLNALVDLGEIRRIKSGDGKDCFDGMLNEHYHARCKCCGLLKDLYIEDKNTFDEIEISLKEVLSANGSDMQLEKILFNYTCPVCKEKNGI